MRPHKQLKCDYVIFLHSFASDEHKADEIEDCTISAFQTSALDSRTATSRPSSHIIHLVASIVCFNIHSVASIVCMRRELLWCVGVVSVHDANIGLELGACVIKYGHTWREVGFLPPVVVHQKQR